MKRILYILIIIALPFFSPGQEKLKTKGIIPVMSWGGIAATEVSVESYKKLKEVGVNIDIAFFPSVEAIAKGLDAAGKAGVKLMISCPELKADPTKVVKQFMNHPALEGYFLSDEPNKSQFQELADWSAVIKAIDKKHYCFVNLYPDINANKSKFGTPTYKEYVDIFDQMFPAPYLSFDYYPVVDGGIHPRWYENMEFFANKYMSEMRPYWAFALTTSYLSYSDDAAQPALDDFYQLYKTYKPERTYVHDVPSYAALSLQVYVNLAYGAQGIEYWSFRGYGTPLDTDGKRTVIYDRVQKISNEIQNLSGVFLGAKMVSVANTGLDIPEGTKQLTKLPLPIKLLETIGTGAVVSQLQNGENNFLVIVNRDFKNTMKLIISTDNTVKRVLKDGTLIPATEYANATEVDPGDVVIYVWK